MTETVEVGSLVRAAQNGDRAAFGQLHAVYGSLVHAIVLARAPATEADDLVQDVFLSAWRQVTSLRNPGAFGSWLGQIARNRTVDYHRRRKKTETLPEDLPRSAPPTAEATEALEAIRALPEAYRETLMLRLVGGWTGPEIAERTGLTPASVRVNLHRGMQLLRSKLGLKGRS